MVSPSKSEAMVCQQKFHKFMKMYVKTKEGGLDVFCEWKISQ